METCLETLSEDIDDIPGTIHLEYLLKCMEAGFSHLTTRLTKPI